MTKNPKPPTGLGAILVRMGCASHDDITTAKAIQASNPSEQLGEVMVRLRMIAREDLDTALAFQERMRGGDAVGAMVDIIQRQTASMMPHAPHTA